MPPSSRGLGQLPFTEQTGIRIPLGVIFYIFISNNNLVKLFYKTLIFTRNFSNLERCNSKVLNRLKFSINRLIELVYVVYF